MNEKILKGKWDQLEGEAQKKWGKLTHNDLLQIKGEVNILKGKLQEKYGKTSNEALHQVDAFVKSIPAVLLKGKWNQAKGDLQKEFGKLTHDDLEQANGDFDILKGKIQEKYGHPAQVANDLLVAYVNSMK